MFLLEKNWETDKISVKKTKYWIYLDFLETKIFVNFQLFF